MIGENDEVPVEAEVIFNSEESGARNITVTEDYRDNGQLIFSKGQNVTDIAGVEDAVVEKYVHDLESDMEDGK